ncbi:MAG: phage baseplate assembly protein V [Gemmatimonadota bacterium]
MQVLVRATIGPLTLLNSEIESLEVDQQLGEHTRCDLEFVIGDRFSTTKLVDLIDKDLVVTVKDEVKDAVEIFQGKVFDGSQTHMADGGNRYILQAVSASIRHDRTMPTYFPESKLASIAGRLGLKLVGSAVDLPVFDHVLWGETEFEFLRRLADEAGMFMVTMGPNVELRNEFKSTEFTLVFGNDVVALTTRMRPTNHTAAGANYDPVGKHSHYHAGVRQAPDALSAAGGLLDKLKSIAPRTAGGGDPKFEPALGRSADQNVFRNMLKHESERALGSALAIELTTVIPGVLAGDLITVIDTLGATAPLDGQLGVIRATHIFRDQHYTCDCVGTGWKKFTYATQPGRPVMDGPVTAEVIDTEDPLKLGRVKVKYRWQNAETNWARVVVPYAGNGRGTYFIPEIGDEVLVQFEAGDPERPFVVGSLWNGKDKPPESMPDNKAKRIVTLSGNTIQLLDKANEETIEIFTKDKKCILQLTNKGGAPCITIQSTGDIAFEAPDGAIRFKCKTMLQDITADSVRKVGGDDSSDVSGNATIKAGGNTGIAGTNVTIKGGANVDSIAGAVNNVIGTLVHLQPPGYMGSPVMAKPAQVQKTDLGDASTPEVAAPKRTADALTPRT